MEANKRRRPRVLCVWNLNKVGVQDSIGPAWDEVSLTLGG
jgi:hypothetical protein